MTDHQGRILTVVVAVAATAIAPLPVPTIAAIVLSGIGGNFASDAAREWLPALRTCLGIRPLFGNALLRAALVETFEQALELLENNYRKTPQYKESTEQGFINMAFASLRDDARSLFTAANAGDRIGTIARMHLEDTAIDSLSLAEALDEYLPDASEHLRGFVTHNLPVFWASSFVQRLSTDQPLWKAFQLQEWNELREAVVALPHSVAETLQDQLSEGAPSAEWLQASKAALEQVTTELEGERTARLDALNLEVQEQGQQTREHISDEADRVIREMHKGQRSRTEALAELGRFIREKTVARLGVLGVQVDTAREVADRILSVDLPTEIASLPPGSVLLLKGPLGAGKTTSAETLLLRAIQTAQHDPDAPIPVRLDAGTMEGQLKEQIVVQCTELGDPAQVGVVAVLDALEQVDPRRAEELLADCIAIARTWPATRIIITGRSDLRGPQSILCYDIPELLEGEWVSLVQEVAEQLTPIFPSTYPESVRKATTRPLFAILLGIWVREQMRERPPTVAALVRHLVDGSLGRAGIDRPDLPACLRLLASKVIESGGRPARLGQVPNGPVLRQALLDTGIVSIDAGSRVTFTLALFAEWLAGEALLEDPHLLADADLDKIMRWRYAIVAAVGGADHEQASAILTALVRTAPAIAGWVIHSTLRNEQAPDSEGNGDTSEEWAERIVNAMDSWRQAMGPLAPVTTPSTDEGEPAAFGVRAQGSHLEYGWSTHPGRIIELPHGPSTTRYRDWSESGFTAAAYDSPYEWLFTWGWVRDRLDDFLRYALIRPPTLALQAEYDWHVAQLAVGWSPSGHDCEAVQIEALEEFLGQVAGYDSVMRGNRAVSVRQVRDLVERHREHGVEAVANPWPCSDQHTGWIPRAWSSQRRLERLQQVCEAALEGYEAAVRQYFPSFKTQLRTYASMPVKLRGYLSEHSGPPDRPMFSDTWYLEPVPEGEPNSVEWVQVDAPPSSDSLWESFLHSRRAHRPNLPRAVTVSGAVAGLEGSRPAMNLVATLLWRDLAAWDWVFGIGPVLFNSNYSFDPIPDRLYWAQSGVLSAS